ncbi:hypothetical protein NPIL_676201, partial [Nephila pilipes]
MTGFKTGDLIQAYFETYVVDARNHGESPWSEVFNLDCNAD